MKTNTYAFKTLHSIHKPKKTPIDQCDDCQELIKKEENVNTQIDQAIEDRYHNHGARR